MSEAWLKWLLKYKRILQETVDKDALGSGAKATPGSREFGRDISIGSRRMDVEGLPHQFL